MPTESVPLLEFVAEVTDNVAEEVDPEFNVSCEAERLSVHP
jgi:hypothetical protein